MWLGRVNKLVQGGKRRDDKGLRGTDQPRIYAVSAEGEMFGLMLKTMED